MRTEVYRLVETTTPGALADVEGSVTISNSWPGALLLLLKKGRARALSERLKASGKAGDGPPCFVIDEKDEKQERPYAALAPLGVQPLAALRAVVDATGCVPLLHPDEALGCLVLLFGCEHKLFVELLQKGGVHAFVDRHAPIILEVTNQYSPTPPTDCVWAYGLRGEGAARRFLLPALEALLGEEAEPRVLLHETSGVHRIEYKSRSVHTDVAVARLCHVESWLPLVDWATGARVPGLQIKLAPTLQELKRKAGLK